MKRLRQYLMRIRARRLLNSGLRQSSENTTQAQSSALRAKGADTARTEHGGYLLERESAVWPAEDLAKFHAETDRQIIEQLRVMTVLNQSSNGLGLPTEDAARKRLQMWTFLMEYFPDSFLAVVEVAVKGNEQHNPGQPLHWSREKSTDHMNTAFRHMWDRGRGVRKDKDGAYHLAKAIWRLNAQLQLDIEEDRRNGIDGTGA